MFGGGGREAAGGVAGGGAEALELLKFAMDCILAMVMVPAGAAVKFSSFFGGWKMVSSLPLAIGYTPS